MKSEYYWYFLTFKITERQGSYSLKRIPAAVASGEFVEFKEVLSEESKRLNRLEEE